MIGRAGKPCARTGSQARPHMIQNAARSGRWPASQTGAQKKTPISHSAMGASTIDPSG
ncbi:hypothetical protein C7S15_4399 [Burkholderia cepacia]|nr:hypothetical protein [Burkholderia cepacia]